MRTALGMTVAVGLVLGGCRGNGGDRQLSSSPADTHSESVEVDPMTFVMLYRVEFNRILQRHQGDCEGGLAALLRFIADQREAFLKAVKDRPAGWQPEVAEAALPVRLWMEYAERCPAQVIRLNQAIHSVTRWPKK